MSAVELSFEIKFRGPFLVGGEAAGDGADVRVNQDILIPGSSIKGRMRAEAANVLKLRKEVIDDVFGSVDEPGKWWFSHVDLKKESYSIRTSNRVAMDPDNPDSGLTDEHQLVFYDQCWAEPASFTVEQLVSMEDSELKQHKAILCAAARSVTNFGAMRRRGHGWVSIMPTSGEDSSEEEIIKILRESRTND